MKDHISNSMKTRHKVQYWCDVNKITFFKSINLIARHRTHMLEKPYPCNVCDQKIANNNKLTVHCPPYTEKKPYPCDVCDKSFGKSTLLKIHKRKHTGEKPYSCDVCDKSFTQKCNLTRHQRTHTGDKPYRCEVCNNSFTQSNSLKAHRLIHSEEKSGSSYVCDKKSFVRKRRPEAHGRTKPFLSDECSKLKSDETSHTTDKPKE